MITRHDDSVPCPTGGSAMVLHDSRYFTCPATGSDRESVTPSRNSELSASLSGVPVIMIIIMSINFTRRRSSVPVQNLSQ